MNYFLFNPPVTLKGLANCLTGSAGIYLNPYIKLAYPGM